MTALLAACGYGPRCAGFLSDWRERLNGYIRKDHLSAEDVAPARTACASGVTDGPALERCSSAVYATGIAANTRDLLRLWMKSPSPPSFLKWSAELSDVGLRFANVNSKVWESAIHYDSHRASYEPAYDFSDSLEQVQLAMDATGLEPLLRTLAEQMVRRAKTLPSDEHRAVAVATVTLLNLGMSPQGSLVSYRAEVSRARGDYQHALLACRTMPDEETARGEP